MSDVASLKVLKDNHKDLLLAEVAALLHDVGKLCDAHIKHVSGQTQWTSDDGYKAIVDDPSQVIRLSRSAANIRKPDIINNLLNVQSPKAADFLPASLKVALTSAKIILLAEEYVLAELMMLGMPGFATHTQREKLLDNKDGWLAALLGVCHNEAHVDKEEPVGGAQTLPHVLTSSAFGFEQQIFVLADREKSLDTSLQSLSFQTNLTHRVTREQIIKAFERGLGDTRRPINEVTLADWSEIVAALFKSGLAGAVLDNNRPKIGQWKSWRDKIIDHDLRWRLLRVNFDVLDLYAKAVKIGDLLGYKRVVDEACEAVKKLIEEEYPLGNEIYRDSTGIYFTFPDLSLPADLAQEIRRRVEEVEMELAPRIAVDQGDGSTATEQLKGILGKARGEAQNELAQPFDSQNLSACWQQQWRTVGPGKCEICPVCGLRPKREDRDVCKTCERRRSSRIVKWKENPSQTIWIDEIADANDRVALIVGKFGLDDWLSGDLVQTMLVRCDPKNSDPKKRFVPKNPSPARLRRVWETCQRFWTETVEQEILAKLPQRTRWELVPENPLAEKTPPREMALDGALNGQPISVFRIGDRLLTISFVTQPQKGTLTINWQDGGRKRRAQIAISQTKTAQDGLAKYQSYPPSLPLLSSPGQFLALVPAAEGLDIAERIKSEYQKQFGKVQNRLPLLLGLIFFQRKMPLMAVMDTARRMLEKPLAGEEWVVDSPPVEEIKKQTENGKQGEHKARVLKLKNATGEMTMRVQTTMGDGSEDKWYPYFIIDGADVSHRTYRFQLKKQGDTHPQKVGEVSDKFAGCWLLHVNDLREGDVVRITPSRFAYLFMESTAQRFRFDPQKDTLLLDELPRLMEMWKKLKDSGITDTALRGVQALLESKGAAWGMNSKEFEHLTYATLKNTGLFEQKDKAGNPLPDMVTPEDVISGRFMRCLELYLHILKKKVSHDSRS